MTFPFPTFCPVSSRGPASLIDRTAGTIITNAAFRTSAAFDGVTSQISDVATVHQAATMYIGKSYISPVAVESVTTYGSTNEGYKRSPTGSITISLYGKAGSAPANGTDGTLLGSITFTNTSNESAGRQIASADTETYWDHVWVYFSGGGTDYIILAELQIYGWQE